MLLSVTVVAFCGYGDMKILRKDSSGWRGKKGINFFLKTEGSCVTNGNCREVRLAVRKKQTATQALKECAG